MKKFFTLILLAFVFAAAGFCEQVLTEEDFYNPWIVGTWTVEVTSIEGDEKESERALVKFEGYTPDSTVIFFEDGEDEGEESTLEDFVSYLYEDMISEFENLTAIKDLGAKISGDTNFHLNNKKNQISFKFIISFEEETAGILIDLKKQK